MQNNSPTQASALGLRLRYGGLLLFSFVLGIIFRLGKTLTAGEYMRFGYYEQCGGAETCLKDQPCYRIAAAAVVFFTFHAIFSSKYNGFLAEPADRIGFSLRYYWLKVIIYVALIVAFLYIPSNGSFLVFAWFALVFSFLYIIAQLVILLGFAYELNDWFSGREGRCAAGLLIAFTFVLFAGAVTMVAFLYVWFGNDKSCAIGQAIITLTLLLAVIYTLLSVYAPHGSLFPSAIVFLYTTWLAFSALSGGITHGQTCNTLSSEPSSVQLGLSAALAAISLTYTVTSGGTSRGTLTGNTNTNNAGPAMNNSNNNLFFGQGEEEATLEANHLSFFHGFLALGAFYTAMMLTNWSITGSGSVAGATNGEVDALDSGAPSMWIKFSSSLLCIALYIWTLAAPLIFPDREFG